MYIAFFSKEEMKSLRKPLEPRLLGECLGHPGPVQVWQDQRTQGSGGYFYLPYYKDLELFKIDNRWTFESKNINFHLPE